MTVAALFVDPKGVYSGLPDVEVWDEARDARLYPGPWPVVAHPPCNRWSKLAAGRRQRDGQDGGCFEAALAAVRKWGGVIEHPAYSLAWQRFGLPKPPACGWSQSLTDPGWSCEIDQRWYGHEMRKPTWLYYVGSTIPPNLEWHTGPWSAMSVQRSYGGGARQAMRSRTPEAMRDVLLRLATDANGDNGTALDMAVASR